MIQKILENLKSNGLVSSLFLDVKENKNVSLFDMSLGTKSWLVGSMQKKVLYVVDSFDIQNKLKGQFESLGKKVEMIFPPDFDLSVSSAKVDESQKSLILSLFKICTNNVDIVICSSNVLFKFLPSKKEFCSKILTFEKGNSYDFQNVISSLLSSNYKKVDMVNNEGEFSVRGDIIDIFSLGEKLPFRLDFFGDDLENITTFNIINYTKISDLQNVSICPNNLIFIENKSQFYSQLDLEVENIKNKLSTECLMRLKSSVEEIKFRVENNNVSGIENFLSVYQKFDGNILRFLSEDFVICFDDVKQLVDNSIQQEKDFYQDFELLEKDGYVFQSHKNLIMKKEEIFNCENQKISFQNIASNRQIFSPDKVYSFRQSAVSNYHANYDLLYEELLYYLEYNNTVIIYAKNDSTTLHLQNFLKSKNMYSKVCVSENQIEKQKVNLITKQVLYGAVFVEEKIAIIGTNELLGKQELQLKKSKTKREAFSMPKIGDFVVHEKYGIGKVVGLERKKFSSFEKDYISLEYSGGDKVYIPTEQIDLISNFVSTSPVQKLSKIGNKEFEKVKEKVKSSVKQMAFDLLKLYAEREQLKGFKYEKDDELTNQFESAFSFEETQDQIEAIKQIKDDMENGKMMDRLVCGDVGFGKTEVALRAIFKAVQSGKQVAFLAPTTILSQQHFNTCFARMNNFMVNVAVLNRFKTPKEQKQILKDLKDGKIDVIVGTHRLLGKDVEFKDLGLLVLDEEQRFGVQDKEKIKNIKKSIDVLTLSATPIPRTLHLSLSGIRDISLITTPPEGRLPVQTVVTEYNDILLKQVINKELSRGGQVIVVYNSVENIYMLAEKIRKMVDENVTIGVAHGQMDERTLENAIYDVYSEKTKILVATTLIENGVNLINANSLFVVDADRLGLSQLYQLRGRVGRGNRLGYAYFTYQKDKVMTQEAYKRLNSLMEFTELGSGFKIAMRDLEIRGCGNIMGKEQHGHMDKVGYDMYCKLLNQAVKELKGEKVQQEREVKIDVSVNAFIPNAYILESEDRFRVYNLLISIKTEQDREKVLSDIKEIYGKNLPQEVVNLSKVSLLRALMQNQNVFRTQINNSKMVMEFFDKNDLIRDNVTKALSLSGLKYSINLSSQPLVIFDIEQKSPKRLLDEAINLLILCEH